MLGFKPQISDVGSDRSANCTTTAQARRNVSYKNFAIRKLSHLTRTFNVHQQTLLQKWQMSGLQMSFGRDNGTGLVCKKIVQKKFLTFWLS